MNDSDLSFIRRILSVAECGKPEFPYSEVYIYADDNRFSPARRQITYSIGFTEGGGNLRKVLERYCTEGGVEASAIRPFLSNLGAKSKGSLAGNQTFIALLKAAGTEELMREIQQEEFDRMYLEPAIAWGEKYGFKENLSFLVIADSYLHSGSMLGFLMNKFAEKKPVDGGDEKKWITDYLAARHSWLRNHSNTILNKTVYRADCYMREAAKDNWDLAAGSVVMHGTTVARLALAILFFALVIAGARAAPYLVSDPYVPQSDPNMNPTQFVIQGLSANPITINATTLSGGNVVLEYDLATLPNGTYHVTAAAVNIFGGESPFSSPPFDFTRGVPGTPTGLHISPTLLQ